MSEGTSGDYVIRTRFEAIIGQALADSQRLQRQYEFLAGSAAYAQSASDRMAQNVGIGIAGAMPTIYRANGALAALGPAANLSAAQTLSSTAAIGAGMLGVVQHASGIAPALQPITPAAASAAQAVAGIATAAQQTGAAISVAAANASAANNSIATSATVAAAAQSTVAQATGAATAAAAALPPPLAQATGAAMAFGNTGSAAMQRVHTSAGQLLGRLAAIGAAYLGFQAIGRTLTNSVQDQLDYEMQRLNVAALIDANILWDGDKNFSRSLGAANSLMSEYLRLGRELPGDARDMSALGAALAGPLLAAGKPLVDLPNYVADSALLAALSGSDPRDTANQLQSILLAGAGLDRPAWQWLLGPGRIGITAEEFNLLPIQQRTDMVFASMRRITSNQELMEELAGSAAVQFDKLRENVFGIESPLGRIGKDLTGGLAAGARRLNEWFSLNEDTTNRIAGSISGILVPAIDLGTSALVFALDNAESLQSALWGAAAAAAAVKIASWLPSPAQGSVAASVLPTGISQTGTLAGLVNLGTAMRTTSVGQLTASARSAVSSGSFSSMFTRISTAAGPLAPMFKGLAAGGLALTGVAATLGGAVYVVKEDVMGLGDMFRDSTGRLGGSLTRLGGTLGGLFIALGTPLGMVLVPAVSALAWALSGLVDVVVGTVDVIGGSVAALSDFAGSSFAAAQRAPLDWFVQSNLGPVNFARDLLGLPEIQQADWLTQARADAWTKYNEFSMASPFGKDPVADSEKEKRGYEDAVRGSSPVINQTIHIQQNFEGHDNPDRIAYVLISELEKLAARTHGPRLDFGF